MWIVLLHNIRTVSYISLNDLKNMKNLVITLPHQHTNDKKIVLNLILTTSKTKVHLSLLRHTYITL